MTRGLSRFQLMEALWVERVLTNGLICWSAASMTELRLDDFRKIQLTRLLTTAISIRFKKEQQVRDVDQSVAVKV